MFRRLTVSNMLLTAVAIGWTCPTAEAQIVGRILDSYQAPRPNGACGMQPCPPNFGAFGHYRENWRRWPSDDRSDLMMKSKLSPFTTGPNGSVPSSIVPEAIDEDAITPRKRNRADSGVSEPLPPGDTSGMGLAPSPPAESELELPSDSVEPNDPFENDLPSSSPPADLPASPDSGGGLFDSLPDTSPPATQPETTPPTSPSDELNDLFDDFSQQALPPTNHVRSMRRQTSASRRLNQRSQPAGTQLAMSARGNPLRALDEPLPATSESDTAERIETTTTQPVAPFGAGERSAQVATDQTPGASPNTSSPAGAGKVPAGMAVPRGYAVPAGYPPHYAAPYPVPPPGYYAPHPYAYPSGYHHPYGPRPGSPHQQPMPQPMPQSSMSTQPLNNASAQARQYAPEYGGTHSVHEARSKTAIVDQEVQSASASLEINESPGKRRNPLR